MNAASASHFIYKRVVAAASDNTVEKEPPPWAFALFFLNIILFTPLLLWLHYTVENVWPVFAIVEDESPPAYEPVALDQESADNAGASSAPIEGGAISSSVRGIHRLLRANGGFRANFRGFFCYMAQGFVRMMFVLFSLGTFGYVFNPVAAWLASLLTVQFATAWVHIIITPRSDLHFWSRLPPFNRTFNATWKVVTLYCVATEISRSLSTVIAYLFDLQEIAHRPEGYSYRKEYLGSFVILLVSLLSMVFIVIPAHVVMVRVMASLLPADAETIIYFDRSFQGQVEPIVASGKGYATISQAWFTFSRGAWRRLVVLYAKIFAIGLAVSGLMIAVTVPQAILIFVSSSNKA